MDQQQPVQGQVQIKADEKELQGQYSNLVMIHHNLEEFTFEFSFTFSQRRAGQAAQQHDCESGPRQAHLARAGREIWPDTRRNLGQLRKLRKAILPTPNVGFVQ